MEWESARSIKVIAIQPCFKRNFLVFYFLLYYVLNFLFFFLIFLLTVKYILIMEGSRKLACHINGTVIVLVYCQL